MKRKRQQEERRRTMAELNLIEETKRQAVRRRGCMSLFGSILVLGVAAAAVGLGLH